MNDKSAIKHNKIASNAATMSYMLIDLGGSNMFI